MRACSRREFLRATAATMGTAAIGTTAIGTTAIVGRWSQAQGADPANRFGGFDVGMQSYSLRAFPIDEALQTINKLGLTSVELFNAHFSSQASDADIEAMKSKTKSLGIQMMGHGVNPFGADHEANRRWFVFAKKAGIKNISADPSEEAFGSLDKLCEEFQIRIAIHNHGPGARYDKIVDVLNAVRGHHPLIGACADLGHYIRSGEDPVRAINLFEGRLYGIHLKDFAEQKAKTEGVILGQGHLDVVGVFGALRKVNFPADGCLSLEYEEHPKNPLPDIEQCLAVASEAARQSAG